MGNSVKSLKIFTKKVRSALRFFTLLWSPLTVGACFVSWCVPNLTEGYLTDWTLCADWLGVHLQAVLNCVLCCWTLSTWESTAVVSVHVHQQELDYWLGLVWLPLKLVMQVLYELHSANMTFASSVNFDNFPLCFISAWLHSLAF